MLVLSLAAEEPTPGNDDLVHRVALLCFHERKRSRMEKAEAQTLRKPGDPEQVVGHSKQ